MKHVVMSCGVLLLSVCGSFGQENQSPDQAETIKALVQEVKDLKAEVAELRAEHAKLAETVASYQKKEEAQAKPPEQKLEAQAKPAQPVSQPQQPVQEAAEERAPYSVPQGIKIQGFGEVDFKVNDARPPEATFFGFRHGANNSFAIGGVDLFITSHLTDKSMVLSEINFRETSDQVFDVNVERMLFKHNFNDYLKASFGRFHTSTSYYNSIFHHGAWLQTAVDRPLVVEFSSNGGLLPTQAVGVSLTGEVPSGKLGLNYIFEYGTSDTVRPNILTAEAPSIDEGNGNGILGGLFVKPASVPGLEIGGSFYHDRLSPTGGEAGGEGGGGAALVHVDQAIVSAHAVYVTPRFEFLNEGFFIRHRVQETGAEFNTPSFYTLISQKFHNRWRPYFRYQYTNASEESPIFPDVRLRHGPSAGLRVDLSDYVAFKLQYDRIYRRELDTINDLIGQLAFRF